MKSRRRNQAIRQDLARASEMLCKVRASTEQAANEILSVLERVHPLLEKAANWEGQNQQTRQALIEARDQLTLILNALQFQDITAQQIEATHAVLANARTNLAEWMEGLEDKNLPQVDVLKGAFDPNAKFDRAEADVAQKEIDRLVDG